MKKLTLIFVLTLTIFICHAQTGKSKTDSTKKYVAPVPKKQFYPDLNKVVTIKVKLPLYAVNDYIFALSNPGFEKSDRLNGKQINGISTNANSIIKALQDSTVNTYFKEIKKQTEKFTADTLKHK